MKGSKVVAYSSDDSGRLRRTRSYIRYVFDSSSSDRVPGDVAVAAGRAVQDTRRGRTPADLAALVNAVEQKLTRLQTYPQFWHDKDMRRFMHLWRFLRVLVREVGA